MALSGLLSQGLVSRSVGTKFERSFSCGDLTSNASGAKDPIQLFASAPGKSQCRSVSSEAISSVNPSIPSHLNDFHRGMAASSHGSLCALGRCDSENMRYVLSLSDLLQEGLASDNDKHLNALESQSRPSKHQVDTIPEEGEDDSHLPHLVPSLSAREACPGEDSLLDDVMDGLFSGHEPQLTEEGTGGTYFLSNAEGLKVAVFKPMDEEPLALNCPRGMTPSTTGEGLKKGTRVGEGAFREVAAHILDYPAAGEESGFAGVPLTFLAECSPEFFHQAPASESDPLNSLDAVKLGSLQQFIPAVSNCEDMGPGKFPVNEVHKIAVLDMRLANTDRNGANILVQKDQSAFRLTPIDHGYCLPETMEDITFEWLYWQQAKAPFDERTLQYIASLDANEDILHLREHGWEVNVAVARTMHACTMLLKKGAARGLTPYAIGSMMVREDFDRESELEGLVEEAEATVDREGLPIAAFLNVLSDLMDQKLAKACKLY